MSNKQLVLIIGPLGTRSGYGAHARDIFYSFHDIGKYDIKVLDTGWGDTPRNALNINNDREKLILDRIITDNQMKRQPDICVDVRIPNEFQPAGKFNIGITAGIETTSVSAQWIEGCNKMNLIIVPSEHSKSGFTNVTYDKMQNMPNGETQKIGELKIEKPIEVLFEGADTDIYKPLKVDEIDKNILKDVNDIVKEKFAFLFVGTWVKGGFGEDRKDIGRLIKIFYETFSNVKNPPALILKTQGATFSVLDNHDIKNKIKSIKNEFPKSINLPNVYFLHGDLKHEEMNSLYNHPKIISMVSFTHGEGFGRPLLEATFAGLPVVASNWSGHVDFLSNDYSLLIGGKIDNIPDGAVWENILIPESKWFTVDDNEARAALQFSLKNRYDMKISSKKLSSFNMKKFSHTKMTQDLEKLIEKYCSNISSPVQLKLPKLKKIDEKSELPKIKLPKLKKV